MKGNICCVTYGELNNLVLEMVEEYKTQDPELEFQIVDGLREETLDRVNKAILNGAEVVIAGGANARIVGDGYFNVPVIEYQVTFEDYLRAVQEACQGGGQPALVTFKEPLSSRFLEPLKRLGFPVTEIVYEDTEELKEKIQHSQADVMIGNGLAVDLAKKLGREAILLYAGKESIRAAVLEACNMIREIHKEREKTAFMQALLNECPDGILYLNSQGELMKCSRSAQRLLEVGGGLIENGEGEQQDGCKFGENTFRHVLKLFAGDEKEESELSVVTWNGNKLIRRRIPVRDENGIGIGTVILLSPYSVDKKTDMDYQKQQQEHRKAKGFVAKHSLKDIIGASDCMRMCKENAALFAQSDASVLIYGETGTGKELFAQGIHNASIRKRGPFVALNCAALPENLLESELFGYDEGAFTGGRKGGKKGLFELAQHGTLFLDEIGEITTSLQARLLRVLQEKEIMHVGGDRMIPVDVRIIAATNKNLEEMEDHRFRRDLLYRLNVLELKIPPLCKRENDVIDLFRFYLNRKAGESAQVPAMSDEVCRLLLRHSWKGNIRELQNVCERYCLFMSRNPRKDGKYARRCMIRSIGEEKIVVELKEQYGGDLSGLIRELKELLGYSNEQIGRILGISRTTLWRIVHKEEQEAE